MFGYKLSPVVIAAVWAASIAATWALARAPGTQAAPPAAPVQAASAAPKLPKIDLEKADELRRKFPSVLADAALLDKRTAVQRIEQVKAAEALRGEAEALYGEVFSPYGQCTKAGISQHSLLFSLSAIAHALQTGRELNMVEIGGIAHQAYALGDSGGACRELLNNASPGRP